MATRRRAMFHFHSGTPVVVGDVPRGGASSRRVSSGLGAGIGMSSVGTGGGGGSGIAAGSGAVGCACGGVVAGRGAAVGTPRGGTLSGSDPNEARTHAPPPIRSTTGMMRAHQALRVGGALEGMSLRRHSSHSPFRSSGSSCFSQIPIGSTIRVAVYHDVRRVVTRSSRRSGRLRGSDRQNHRPHRRWPFAARRRSPPC